MANYITIDGGTTNTRISLVCDNNIIHTLKFGVGAKVGSQNKELLKDTIKNGISEILSKNSKTESCISKIIASGMITSEGGLCELEHLVAPCGINELSNAMHEVTLDEISSIPFVFIRGIKLGGNCFESADMMRGEETELMGLGDELLPDTLYVLPGSHSKLVSTDSIGMIFDFSTHMTGELISAIANDTILKNSVDLTGSSINEEYLFKGYDYAMKNGISSALFKTRIIHKLFSGNNDMVYSFFMGCVLSPEIMNIINSKAKKVVICGKEELKAPTIMLIKKFGNKEVLPIGELESAIAPSIGAVRIYEKSIND